MKSGGTVLNDHRHVVWGWIAVGGLLGIGLLLRTPAPVVLAILGGPFVGVATFKLVKHRRAPEALRAGWGAVHHAVLAALALAGVVGVVASAGRSVESIATIHNGPLNLMFVAATILAWRALFRPSPRRAAVIACVVHIAWVPVLLSNSHRTSHAAFLFDAGTYSERGIVVGLCGVLGLSALASVLAVVAFRGIPVAEARARR